MNRFGGRKWKEEMMEKEYKEEIILKHINETIQEETNERRL